MDPVSPRLVKHRVTHLQVEVSRLNNELSAADREIRLHEKKIEEAKYTQELLRYFLAVTRKELNELTKDGQVGPASKAGVP
jgi:chromosome segregation ATPase